MDLTEMWVDKDLAATEGIALPLNVSWEKDGGLLCFGTISYWLGLGGSKDVGRLRRDRGAELRGLIGEYGPWLSFATFLRA